jgi:hypothetical protein
MKQVLSVLSDLCGKNEYKNGPLLRGVHQTMLFRDGI